MSTNNQLLAHYRDLKRRIEAGEPYDRRELGGPLVAPQPPPLPTRSRPLAAALRQRTLAAVETLHRERLEDDPELTREQFLSELQQDAERDPDAVRELLEHVEPELFTGAERLGAQRAATLADQAPMLERALPAPLRSAVSTALRTLTGAERAALESVQREAADDDDPRVAGARLYTEVARLRPDLVRDAVPIDYDSMLSMAQAVDALPTPPAIEPAPTEAERTHSAIAAAPLDKLGEVVHEFTKPGATARFTPEPELKLAKPAADMSDDELGSAVRSLADKSEGLSTPHTVIVP